MNSRPSQRPQNVSNVFGTRQSRCASPNRTFSGVQPQAATSLALGIAFTVASGCCLQGRGPLWSQLLVDAAGHHERAPLAPHLTLYNTSSEVVQGFFCRGASQVAIRLRLVLRAHDVPPFPGFLHGIYRSYTWKAVNKAVSASSPSRSLRSGPVGVPPPLDIPLPPPHGPLRD